MIYLPFSVPIFQGDLALYFFYMEKYLRYLQYLHLLIFLKGGKELSLSEDLKLIFPLIIGVSSIVFEHELSLMEIADVVELLANNFWKSISVYKIFVIDIVNYYEVNCYMIQ